MLFEYLTKRNLVVVLIGVVVTLLESVQAGELTNNQIALVPDYKLSVKELRFSTKAYEQEALEFVIREANQAARQLNLGETLPITKSNLTHAFIVGYGMSRTDPGMIGNVHTRNYAYFVSVGHKLSSVQTEHYDQVCLNWREHDLWPTNRIDTNSAYQLAVQWLSAVSMDVKGLNKDCIVHVGPNSYWNRGLINKGNFVPIYDISWVSPQQEAEKFGDIASVSLFAPTKTLISLSVRDNKYILRNPIVFTNLDVLLSSTNASRP